MLWLGLGSVFVPPPAPAQLATAVTSQAADTSAALRPGDLIRLRIWREPDFSGDFPVDATRSRRAPRLGALDVTSVPAESLKATLVRGYRTFLNHSSIDVVFLRRVQIAGAVQKPGLYHVDPIMTVGDALALAGGVYPGDGGQGGNHSRGRKVARHNFRPDAHQSLPGPLGGSAVRAGAELGQPQSGGDRGRDLGGERIALSGGSLRAADE